MTFVVQGLQLGPSAASASVEVTQGSGIIVTASVVDNTTNDLTTVLALR